MSNFILAMVSIVYVLVCLTKESDQAKGPPLKSAVDCSKKDAEE